jgi:DNA-binding CsgD family transcriptional regulator
LNNLAATQKSLSSDILVQQFFQATFDSSPIGISVCDADLRIVLVNNAWAAMDGISTGAHKGKTPQEVLGVGACPIEDEMKHVLSSGVARFGLEITAKLPSRSNVGRWLVHLIPLKDSSGRTTHVGGITIETTPRMGFQSYLVAHAHAIPSSIPEYERSAGVHLSPREIEVTRYLAKGMSNKQISSFLNISVSTVDTHRRRVMKNLNIHSVAELAVYAVRKGIVDIS